MRFRLAAASALALAVWTSAPALASGSDTPDARSIAATLIPAGATAILIDGTPNEEVWAKAPVIKDFGQRRPAEGSAPAFGRVLRETMSHYLLGVEPTANDWDGRKLMVKVKTSAKGATVRAVREIIAQ